MDWYEERFLAPDDDRRTIRAASAASGPRPQAAASPPRWWSRRGSTPLRDEGEAYARRLGERPACAASTCAATPASVHGFIHFFALGPGSRQAVAEMGGVLRAAALAPLVSAVPWHLARRGAGRERHVPWPTTRIWQTGFASRSATSAA